MDIDVKGLDQFERLEQYWDLWLRLRAPAVTTEAIAEDARLRLEDDVTAPNGAAWPAWSPAYAETRGPQHKLLYGEGDLAESILAKVQAGDYVVGSDRPYALAHQFGPKGRKEKKRPYVGLSRELKAALDDVYTSDFETGWAAF
jgi:phage gpG-like protein